jgi:hypothetical protein
MSTTWKGNSCRFIILFYVGETMVEDDTTIWAIPDADDDDRDDDDEGGATTFRSTITTLVSICPRLSMMRMMKTTAMRPILSSLIAS